MDEWLLWLAIRTIKHERCGVAPEGAVATQFVLTAFNAA
jgi:hypothetical protein